MVASTSSMPSVETAGAAVVPAEGGWASHILTRPSWETSPSSSTRLSSASVATSCVASSTRLVRGLSPLEGTERALCDPTVGPLAADGVVSAESTSASPPPSRASRSHAASGGRCGVFSASAARSSRFRFGFCTASATLRARSASVWSSLKPAAPLPPSKRKPRSSNGAVLTCGSQPATSILGRIEVPELEAASRDTKTSTRETRVTASAARLCAWSMPQPAHASLCICISTTIGLATPDSSSE
mmetsp:Transcript_9189/g.19993  ORF Transcript_9189/g.19993 Transcript_9189/m.19993 type:complete len:244 (-) Transcript_9189:979-1710(-)